MNIDLNHSKIVLQLSYLNVIKISGRDAIGFLNDQFTNDITALEPGHWQFNGYCSSKGRLIAVFRLFVSDDCVYIVLPRRLSEQLIERLRRYVFRAKVKFEQMADHSVYGLMGTDIHDTTIVKSLSNLEPQKYLSGDGGFTLNISLNSNRYLAILNSADALKDLDTASQDTSERLWRLSEIKDGVPNIDIETSELFIPQHVNLDKLNGISFKKGCFPGQEVVARLHYLGKAKQTMRQLEIDLNKPIEPGETLTHPAYQKALKIVDAVRTNQNRFEFLAVGQFE